jgi:hypothetical protein
MSTMSTMSTVYCCRALLANVWGLATTAGAEEAARARKRVEGETSAGLKMNGAPTIICLLNLVARIFNFAGQRSPRWIVLPTALVYLVQHTRSRAASSNPVQHLID